MKSQIREITSRNVIAKIDGAQKPEEGIVVTAHWDHLGINPKLEGDQIFNGALDNATGISGMLEIAKSFSNFAFATVANSCFSGHRRRGARTAGRQVLLRKILHYR